MKFRSERVMDAVVMSGVGAIVTLSLGKMFDSVIARLSDAPKDESLVTVFGFHLRGGDIFIFLVIASAIFVAWRAKTNNSAIPSVEVADSARATFHVYGGTRTPECTSHNNIFRWYFLSQVLVTPSPTGGVHQVVGVTLFITFEPDVRITTLRVTSPDASLPPLEVKEFNQKFAIVAFMGDIPSCTLEVRVGS